MGLTTVNCEPADGVQLPPLPPSKRSYLGVGGVRLAGSVNTYGTRIGARDHDVAVDLEVAVEGRAALRLEDGDVLVASRCIGPEHVDHHLC